MSPSFPHDLFLVFRANMQRLRDSVRTAPLAVVFGGGPDFAGCLLRVNDALDHGAVNAPNLLAVAMGSPAAAPEADLPDVPDDDLVGSCEDALRQLLVEATPCSCGSHSATVSMIFGARQIAFGFIIRRDPNDPPADVALRAGLTGLADSMTRATGRLEATFTEL